jgi:hypothetical protein
LTTWAETEETIRTKTAAAHFFMGANYSINMEREI